MTLLPPATPRYIGVIGRKKHGKSAIAEILSRNGYRPCYFGDSLKRACMDIYDLSYAQVYGSTEEKEALDVRWGMTPREILQRFGTEVGRSVHGDTWVRALREQIRRCEEQQEVPDYDDGKFRIRGWRWTIGSVADRPKRGWVVADCRYSNEVAAIHAWGGEVWRVVRPNCPPTGVGDDHESERYADSLPADREILNDGTLDDLATLVRGALNP